MRSKFFFFNIKAEMAIFSLMMIFVLLVLVELVFVGANTVVCEPLQVDGNTVSTVSLVQPMQSFPIVLDEKLQNTRQFADFTSHKEFLEHYKGTCVPSNNDGYVTPTEVFIFTSLLFIGFVYAAYYT